MLIHGEEIALRCDHLLLHETKFISYPRFVNEATDKYINITTFGDNEYPIYNKRHIFVSTDDLWHWHLINCLSHCQNDFVLVCACSDHPFIDVLLPLFEKLPRLQHVWTTNCYVQDPRISPIPLGFPNKMWWHTENDLEYIERFKKAVETGNIVKDRLAYFNFSVVTNPIDRKPCRDILEAKGFVWDDIRPFVEYIPHLARHKYCICPVGNGYDTHRFWEALAVRTIPVCLHNPIVDFYAQFLPVVVLNKWEELSVEMLEGVQGVDWSNLDTLLDVNNWNMFGPKNKP